jgi:hypothetical protein
MEVKAMAARVENFQEVLEAARQLSVEEQWALAEQLLGNLPSGRTGKPQLSLAEQMWGTIQNVDRETLIQLAEDEEYSGY